MFEGNGGDLRIGLAQQSLHDGQRWVHLDIAGPAWTTKDRGYIPKGASGIPVRLLVEFLRRRCGW